MCHMTETQNIEYKSSWHDDYLKWICGFANANGGVLFIGKGDNGKVVGISDAKRLMEEIPNKVRDLLGITVDVNLLHEGGLEYIEIVISSSVEAWGRGTLKIIEECKKHGLPEPEFAILNGGLSVTIFKDRYTEEQLEKLGFSKRQIKAVLYAKRKGVITNKEYQIIADVKKTTATTELKSLVDSNILIQEGTKGAGAKYTFHK
jgi:predicted HTH transcriptional regulator